MSPDFQQLMRQATQLTRSGDLAAAQALLQQALGAAAPLSPATRSSSAAYDVIDVIATELPESAARASRPDVEAREPLRRPAPDGFIRPGPRPAANPAMNPGMRPGVTSGSHAAAGLHCDYELFVPPQAAGGKTLPLLVMLHGCTQDPRDFAAGTRMNDLAREQGLIVLYPAQSRRMNPQRCWNWFKHSHQARGKGEPALLASLVQQIIREQAVDADRVHVAGLSAGGAMAAVLGETYPELFAAVGVHSGLAPGVAADLPSALAAMKGGGTAAKPALAKGRPVIVFHGDADPTVHPSNGNGVVSRWTQAPAEAQHVAAAQPGGRAATRRIHRGADGQVQAEYWMVHGAAHAWSGGSPAGSYTDSRGPDASAEMLRFFAEHPLR